MAKKGFTAQKLASIEASTRLIKIANRLLCLALAVAFGLVIAATAAPQKKGYDELQAKLRATLAREQAALDNKEHKEIQLHALREDTTYLELQARDRLNYYRPGERVLRFDRDQ
jgi:cell division protein FtsB